VRKESLRGKEGSCVYEKVKGKGAYFEAPVHGDRREGVEESEKRHKTEFPSTPRSEKESLGSSIGISWAKVHVSVTVKDHPVTLEMVGNGVNEGLEDGKVK